MKQQGTTEQFFYIYPAGSNDDQNMPTCTGEVKTLLCRPARGKQRLCCADLRGGKQRLFCADLRRGSEGSVVPTCAGEVKALLC